VVSRTLRLSADTAGIGHAVQILRSGGIGAIPTETVYGLAGRYDNLRAVAAIFEAKERPTFDPLIVHVRSIAHAQAIGELDALPWVRPLAERFWPGPLTLIVPRREHVDPLVTGDLPTVALRCPAHPVATAVLDDGGFGLAAPSANRFGHVSPTTAAHVLADLDGRIDFVLDGGPCVAGLESTIIGADDDGRPTLLRLGALDASVIEQALGEELQQGVRVLERPLAPGQLARHYAPSKPLRLIIANTLTAELTPTPFTGLLVIGGDIRFVRGHQAYAQTWNLAPDADWVKAAAGLYEHLRVLETSSGVNAVDVLLAPSDSGLRAAIADRLARAAVQ
jgi:L-threonylcarbamoyladenylate synthase